MALISRTTFPLTVTVMVSGGGGGSLVHDFDRQRMATLVNFHRHNLPHHAVLLPTGRKFASALDFLRQPGRQALAFSLIKKAAGLMVINVSPDRATFVVRYGDIDLHPGFPLVCRVSEFRRWRAGVINNPRGWRLALAPVVRLAGFIFGRQRQCGEQSTHQQQTEYACHFHKFSSENFF